MLTRLIFGTFTCLVFCALGDLGGRLGLNPAGIGALIFVGAHAFSAFLKHVSRPRLPPPPAVQAGAL
jgi:hypothetical protein